MRNEGEIQLEEQAHLFFPHCGKKADTVIQQSVCQDTETRKNLDLSLETTPGYHYPP